MKTTELPCHKLVGEYHLINHCYNACRATARGVRAPVAGLYNTLRAFHAEEGADTPTEM